MNVLLIAAAMVLTCSSAHAADVFVYPEKGQTKEQQQKDELDCHTWAKEQTGFDPSAPAPAASAPAPARRTGPLRGAAKGAAVGAVGGAIAGDAGKGAAVGAGVGATAGAIRRAEQHHEQLQHDAAAGAQQEAARSAYQRALAACLEARGYSVK